MEIGNLKNRIGRLQFSEKAFLDVFEDIYSDYIVQKKSHDCIDFNDMILQSTSLIREKKYQSPFKHILIDEFQDISIARSNLLIELRKLVDNSVITAVGDDWQSINQFAGSDVAIMMNFEKYYGDTAITHLENTFRYDNTICNVATNFILKNDKQISKRITPINQNKDSHIYIYWTTNDSEDWLDYILEEIVKNIQGQSTKTLYILGRYNFQKPASLKKMKSKYKKLEIYYSTIHSSKGKEADFVILIGLESGWYGFPSEVEDDPLLNLVLTKSDNFPFSEERRLFYVAITRTREKLFLVANLYNRSSFMDELLEVKDDKLIEMNEKVGELSQCPDCKTGSLVRRISQEDHSFYGCSNFPYCRHTEDILYCPECHCELKKLPLQNISKCSNNDCGYYVELCPECSGSIVSRNGQYGPFIGCSNYPDCTYTRSDKNSNCRDNGYSISHQQDRFETDNNVNFFTVNQQVRHDKFGVGIVNEVLDLGDNSIVVVRFNSGQTKSLMIKYAKLKII